MRHSSYTFFSAHAGRWVLGLIMMLFPASRAFALHPLISDDAITQGKGVLELELNYQYSYDTYSEISWDPQELLESELDGQSVFGEVRVREGVHQAGIGLSYGIIAPLDIAVSVPYKNAYIRERHQFYTGPLQGFFLREHETVTGLSDASLEFKWKFYEYNFLSLALKPGFILPTGNFERGLGAGKFGCYAYFITTLDLKQVLMHFNLGYIRNQNRINEREDLWHASLAFEFWLVKDYFRLVANAGFERNRDKWSNVQDAFILAGLIASLSQTCDLDIGFKYSIQTKSWESPGPDYTILAGATVWFGYLPPADKVGEKKDIKEKKG
jgi:hypothetical protein